MPELSSTSDLVQALDDLRLWQAKSISATFDDEWDQDSNWADVKFDRQRATRDEAELAAWHVMKAFKPAGIALLEMAGLSLSGRDEVHFDFEADIANGMFSYVALQPADYRLTLSQLERTWPLRGPEFFDDIAFVSTRGDPFRFFDECRPHLAVVLTLTGNGEHGPSMDARPPNIWPEYAGPEFSNLFQLLVQTFKPKDTVQADSSWRMELVVDMKEGHITYSQNESVRPDIQLLAGILPIDELVWLAADHVSSQKDCDTTIAEFADTGIAARAVSAEEVEARVCIPEPEPTDFDEITQWHAGDVESDLDDGLEDERRLLREEMSSDGEAYARADDEGWFYDDKN